MKRKDELNIDAISGIDDRFVDKVSQKRYELSSKKRKPKWIIPSSIAAAVMVVLMVPILMLFITKQAPIYEGMTAHDANSAATIEVYGEGVSFLSAGKSDQGNFEWLKEGDNGNHTGHGTNDSSSIDILSQDVIYYTRKNTDFYIKVHISNPDNYEILSFTLNGKKYSSYMFEEGSDMETLILKCNVGDVEGIVEYTIDAIKYVDGTAIKDVEMRGERTIKIGVYTDKQPTASIENEQIGLDHVSFDVNISDHLELIKMSGGSAWVELLKNGSVIAQKDISLTESTRVEFDSLDINTEYEYRIMARFDALDGKGTISRTIRSARVKTQEAFELNMSDTTQTEASFTIKWNDIVKDKKLSTLALYKGNEKVKDLAVDATFIDGLLSGIEYTLIGTYELNGQTTTLTCNFRTVAKTEPTFSIKDVTSSTYTINGAYELTDVDNTLISYTVSLLKGNELVMENADKKIDFDFLDYYTDYIVKITYSFDLNDGNGTQTKHVGQAVKTAPFLGVTSVQVLDKKDAYMEGDKATVAISVDNPLRLEFNSVTISGKKHSIGSSTTSNLIFLDIDDVATLGNKIIEEFNVSIDGTDYIIDLAAKPKLDILVMGKIKINSKEIVNENFEPIEGYAEITDKLYLVINADNLEGNRITSMHIEYFAPVERNPNNDGDAPHRFRVFSADEIFRLDDHRIYIELDFLQVADYSFGCIDLWYENDYVDKQRVTHTVAGTGEFDTPLIILQSIEPRSIYTVEDFRSMESGYYYQLENDLDFSGITDFYGIRFYGVFDGQGHSIKNITMIDGEYEHGLFSLLTGVVSNVNMKNFVSVFTDGGQHGAIAADTWHCSIIKNCSTDEHCVLKGGSIEGGICGMSSGVIIDCTNYANSSNDENNIPALVGNGNVIINCNNHGTIYSNVPTE